MTGTGLDVIGEVSHPEFLKTGTRLMMRVWRNKDKPEGRRPGRTVITHDCYSWQEAADELLDECIPGERVYASAEARNVEKAIRVFKERQLAADYDDPKVRADFYHTLETRWLSCLGAPQASAETYFLFDCDDEGVAAMAERELFQLGGIATVVHDYATKSGRHILTRPFNPALVSLSVRDLLHKNPLLLVGWVSE